MRHVKTPTMLQMEATECGAAALGIILGYFKRFVPLEELRIACGVSRDGSNAANIVSAAEHYGLKAEGYKVSLDSLAEGPFPCIAFWEFNHFIVVEGIHKNKIYINDPAVGRRVVAMDTFKKSYTGVVLFFEKTPHFIKTGKPESVLKTFKQRLHGFVRTLFFVILASIALVIPSTLIAGFSKIFIDNILIQQQYKWLTPLIIAMGATGIVLGLLTWLQQFHLLKLQTKMLVISTRKFFWHILHLPMTFFYQRYTGDVNDRIGANDRISSLLSTNVSANMVNLLAMLFYAVFIWLLNWQLALVGYFVALFNGGLLLYIARTIADRSRTFLQDSGKLAGIEMNGLQLMETIKATAAEDNFFHRWAGQYAKTINQQRRIAMFDQILSIAPQLLAGLRTVTILGFGSWQIMQGHLTIGTLIAFQVLLASFNRPLSGLLGFGSQIQKIRGDLARLDDVLHFKVDLRSLQKETKTSTTTFRGDITIRNLNFGYSLLANPLFKNINLQIKARKAVAIVGRSGSGKSTLAKLISGLYTAWSGEILIDEVAISKLPQVLLAKNLAIVDQDIFLFEGSLRDNLTLWDNSIPDSRLWEVLNTVYLADEIRNRGGLDAEILETGCNFSGGQRQRIEIARALVNHPKILILDEATSSLDPVTEKHIYKNLQQYNCTLVIIAHRLSSIRDADNIVVLQNGNIVEQGNHQALLEANGIYQQLVGKEL